MTKNQKLKQQREDFTEWCRLRNNGNKNFKHVLKYTLDVNGFEEVSKIPDDKFLSFRASWGAEREWKCEPCGHIWLDEPKMGGEKLAALNANKDFPVFSGVLNYFPDAIKAVAHCSKVGNDQHNPNEPLHWAREKGGNDLDALSRHLLKAGTMDTDGVAHSAKVAWRALANLQREIEAAQ